MPVENRSLEGRLQRLEAVQAMMLEVGRASLSCSDISEFLKVVHVALKRIMYAENFYVTLYNKDASTIQYVYNKDEIDEDLDTEEEFPMASADESPTAWVIMNRQPLLMTAAEDAARNDAGDAWGSGSIADHWRKPLRNAPTILPSVLRQIDPTMCDAGHVKFAPVAGSYR